MISIYIIILVFGLLVDRMRNLKSGVECVFILVLKFVNLVGEDLLFCLYFMF